MNTMDADRKGGCDMFETCVSDNGIVYYPSHMKKRGAPARTPPRRYRLEE